MSKRLFVLSIAAFWLLSAQAIGQGPPPIGPPVFVSNFTGNQILSVDTTGGTITTINTDAPERPEGIVVGPDGKIYVCDPDDSRVRRMNQDGTQAETIFDQSTATGCTDNSNNAVACPTGSEGPSFNGTDLFFNTRGAPAGAHTGIWKIPGVEAIAFGGPFPAPTNVIPATCIGDSTLCTNSTFGEGTAVETFVSLGKLIRPVAHPGSPASYATLRKEFSTFPGLLASAGAFKGMFRSRPAATPSPSAGDPLLLIVDRSTPTILEWSIGSNTTSTLASNNTCDTTCLDVPIGIAVNNNTGDIYVGNLGHSGTTGGVSHFDTFGNFMGTLVSSTTTNGFGAGDRPSYLQVDSAGNLIVGTSEVSFDDGGNPIATTTGKAWKVDKTTGQATLIAALTCLGECTPPPIAGVALPSASITEVMNPGGNNFIFGQYNAKFQYAPGTTFPAGETLTVTAILTTQADLTSQTSGEGATCTGALIVPYDGAAGNGVTFATTCSPIDCATLATTDPVTYEFLTSYNGPVPGFPGLLKKRDTDSTYCGAGTPPPPADGNILDNFFILRIDPTGAGRTKPGFSHFILVDLPPSPTTAATFNGFLPPLKPGNGRVFSAGTTVAVKFTLTGLSSSFDPTQVVAHLSIEMTSTPQGAKTANFKGVPSNVFLLRKGTFQYYLDTTGFAPGGYTLIVTSNSFPIQMVTFTVTP